MMDLIRSEPVMTQAVIQAFLAMLLSFGIHLTSEQVGAIMAFTAAFLAIIVRSKVTPVNKP